MGTPSGFSQDELGNVIKADVDFGKVTSDQIRLYCQQLHYVQVLIAGASAHEEVAFTLLEESQLLVNDYGDAITASVGFPLSARDITSGSFGTPVNVAWLIGKDLVQECVSRGGDAIQVIADHEDNPNDCSPVIQLSLKYHVNCHNIANPEKPIELVGVDLNADQQRRLSIIRSVKGDQVSQPQADPPVA